MNDDVPLVVSEVNPEALDTPQGHHRQPELLDDADGRRTQADPGRRGNRAPGDQHLPGGVRQRQGRRRRAPGPVPRAPSRGRRSRAGKYAHQIAFNALPHAGSFAPGDDHTDEERKLINETRKILSDPSIRISATCVRVPVVNGHSEAVNVQTRTPLAPERARELLRAAPGITVLDDPAAGLYPMAINATGSDEVFVGRIRRDPGNEQRTRHVDRGRQPAQGRRHQRGTARRAAASSAARSARTAILSQREHGARRRPAGRSRRRSREMMLR